MPIYRGRDVEAFQIGSGPLPDWIQDLEPSGPNADKNYVTIETCKGKKSVHVNDWVIRFPDGTLKRMRDEKFRNFYEEFPSPEQQQREIQNLIDNISLESRERNTKYA